MLVHTKQTNLQLSRNTHFKNNKAARLSGTFSHDLQHTMTTRPTQATCTHLNSSATYLCSKHDFPTAKSPVPSVTQRENLYQATYANPIHCQQRPA